jgi:hypothetical protein
MAKDNSSNPYASDDVGMVVTFSFTNSGARTGVVEDVLLRVRSEEGLDKWLFRPALQIDNSKMMSTKTVESPKIPSSLVGVSLPNAVMGSFYPVAVAGKQSVTFTRRLALPDVLAAGARHRLRGLFLCHRLLADRTISAPHIESAFSSTNARGNAAGHVKLTDHCVEFFQLLQCCEKLQRFPVGCYRPS